MKEQFTWILGSLLFVIFVLLIAMYSENITHLKTKEELELYKDEVNDLYQTIGEYENNENWYEDWIEVMIEVKNQEMQNAILEERIYWLEKEPIIITEKETIYKKLYSCNMFALIDDIQKAIDDGYTFEVVDGVFIEYRNGVATGDTWTNEDITNDYCYIILD